MTAQEKAKELFDKCYYKIEDATAGLFENDVDYLTARRKAATWCSLIAVDEILNQYEKGKFDYKILCEEESIYWTAVRAEIEGL